jgi:hypothetical protein
MSLIYAEGETLGWAMFARAELGDRRRTARLVETFDRMRRHPGGTLPDKLASPPNLKALYRLCRHEQTTHAALIDAMRQFTLDNIAAQEDSAATVLLIHDATELDYTHRASIGEELGQIGNGNRRGLLCQNVLAVDPQTKSVLGLMDQVLHRRDDVPPNETLTARRNRRTRESLLWPHGTRHLPAARRFVDVADQGADTFEFLEHEARSGRTFVVRAYKPRQVQAGHDGVGPREYLADYVRGLPALGQFTMDVQAQRGRKARKDASFTIRGAAVLVHRPHARAGHHGNAPLPLYVVLVSEDHPPAGEKPVVWMLLTNEPIRDLDDARRVVEWYAARWVIEEFHKAQKTGSGIESLQFTSIERLAPAIALLSAVALTLLGLRDASRREDAATRRATTIVDRDYVAVLTAWRYGEVRMHVSVRDFYHALARLGGHQNRRYDHRPGWLVLWRGWMKLQSMLVGYQTTPRTRSG